MQTQYANSQRSRNVCGLLGARAPSALRPKTVCAQYANSLQTVYEQPAFPNCQRPIPRATPDHPATRNSMRTVCEQCAKSARSQAVREIFGEGSPAALRAKNSLRSQSADSRRSQTVRGLLCGGGPEHRATQNSRRAQSTNNLRPKTAPGLLRGRPRAPCGSKQCARRPRTACVRRLFAAYSADCLRAPWGPTQSAKKSADSLHSQAYRGKVSRRAASTPGVNAFAHFSRTFFRTDPEHTATQNSLRTQSTNTLRSHTVCRLSGGQYVKTMRT